MWNWTPVYPIAKYYRFGRQSSRMAWRWGLNGLFRENYELIKEVKAGASIQSVLNKYRIPVNMWNWVNDSEPEILEKVKKYEFTKKKSSKTSDNTLVVPFTKWQSTLVLAAGDLRPRCKMTGLRRRRLTSAFMRNAKFETLFAISKVL